MRGLTNSAFVGGMLRSGGGLQSGAADTSTFAAAIAICEAELTTQANPIYTNYCVQRCSLWNSDYGVSFCGTAVRTDGQALIQCLYKMEGPACKVGGSNPAYPPAITTTTTTTTTTRPVTTRPVTTTAATTTAATTTPATTPATTTTPTTTTPTTTTPTTTTPTTTTPTTTTPTTTTPTTTTSTSAAQSTTAHTGYGAGYWLPSDHPSQSVGNSATGPNGECIWGWSNTDGTAGGTYAGVGNKVYQNKYWADPSDVPGRSSVWDHVTDCIGTAPQTWSEADMASLVEDPTRFTMFYDPWTPSMPTRSEIEAIEAALAQDEQVKILKEAVVVLPAEQVELIAPGSSANPENVKRVESFLTAAHWEKMFPFRHVAYSYENFLKAVGAFPSYCRTYTDGRNSDDICKKLVAASFAHYAQETGANAPAWTLNMNDCPAENRHEAARQYFDPSTPIPTYLQGLYWLRETAFSGSNAESITSSGYERCSPQSDQPWSIVFECPGNVTYYGRGSKQLSWNYNYGLFSLAMYGDASILLKNPRAVAETWLNFASGIWFAVTPQSPKPPMVWALDGTWKKNAIDSAANLEPGFGATIEIINGGYECRNASTSPQAANRIRAYQNFMKLFGLEIPAGESNDCVGSKGFPTNSPVSTQYYWNKDWSKPFTCKVGTVQSPFTVVTPGDYGHCVDFYWRSHIMLNGKEIIRNGESVF